MCQCSGSRPDSCRVYGDVTVGFSLMYSHQSSRQQLWTREKHRWLISSQCFTECYCGAQTEAQTEASSKVQLLNEIHFQVINADQWRTWSSCVHHKKRECRLISSPSSLYRVWAAVLRLASGGTREPKVTCPNVCRLEEIQLENTSGVSTAWQDSTCKHRDGLLLNLASNIFK